MYDGFHVNVNQKCRRLKSYSLLSILYIILVMLINLINLILSISISNDFLSQIDFLSLSLSKLPLTSSKSFPISRRKEAEEKFTAKVVKKSLVNTKLIKLSITKLICLISSTVRSWLMCLIPHLPPFS